LTRAHPSNKREHARSLTLVGLKKAIERFLANRTALRDTREAKEFRGGSEIDALSSQIFLLS